MSSDNSARDNPVLTISPADFGLTGKILFLVPEVSEITCG
jgi:hypothetical protein